MLKGDAVKDKVSVGLGLAVSKHIVSEYNGRISFISVHQKGSSFSFFMDLEEADSKTVPSFGQEVSSNIEQIVSSTENVAN